MNWTEGKPEVEGLYWVHDAVNGVLFAMVVHIQEKSDDGEYVVDDLYYYVMGCDVGFPVSQLTHHIKVTPPKPPLGSSHVSGEVDDLSGSTG